jgi:uncharacterized membrane protein YagU involved in acid resistance
MPTPAQLALSALQHFTLAIVYGLIFCLVAYCFIG